jgi:galactonate dehydratase
MAASTSIEGSMKIDSMDTILAGDSLFVRLVTDSGLVGYGQTGYWGYPDSVGLVVESFRDKLIGADPLARERIWNELYRSQPFRGGVVTAAVAAVDIALWDIAGLQFEVPCYVLMGGPVRDRIRLHSVLASGWLESRDGLQDLVDEAKASVAEGFTALKFDPFMDGDDGFQTKSWARQLLDASQAVGAVRDAVGWDVDIAIELHRKLSTGEAGPLYEELRQHRVYMIEDALSPDGINRWALLPAGVAPTGTGERLDSIWDFADLVATDRVDILRPDVGQAGGMSHTLKIAALAEAHGLRLLCHNYVGPLLTLATAHVYGSVMNVSTMEYTLLDEQSPRVQILGTPAKRVGGYLELPTAPGLGYGTVTTEHLGPFNRWHPHGLPTTPDGGLHVR